MSSSTECPPEYFTCPLTLEVMSHPVQHKVTKHNFERGAIMEWIYFGKATCPLTRQKLHPLDFVANTDLEREINQWKKDHKIEVCSSDDCNCDHHLEDLQSRRTIKNAEVFEPAPRDLKHLMNLRNKVLQKRDARFKTIVQQRSC